MNNETLSASVAQNANFLQVCSVAAAFDGDTLTIRLTMASDDACDVKDASREAARSRALDAAEAAGSGFDGALLLLQE